MRHLLPCCRPYSCPVVFVVLGWSCLLLLVGNVWIMLFVLVSRRCESSLLLLCVCLCCALCVTNTLGSIRWVR